MRIFAEQSESPTSRIRFGKPDFGGTDMSGEEDSYIRRIMEAEVYGHRKRGRPKKRWIDVIKADLSN